MIKKLALVLVALSSSLFASGCVQEMWDAYVGGVAAFVGDKVYDLLDTNFPI